MRRIMLLVTAGLAMAAMMAIGAGAALADKGGGGHDGCTEPSGKCIFTYGGEDQDGGLGGVTIYDVNEDMISVSGGGSDQSGGGGGGHYTAAPEGTTISGGGGGPGGGGGGRCDTEPNGSSPPCL